MPPIERVYCKGCAHSKRFEELGKAYKNKHRCDLYPFRDIVTSKVLEDFAVLCNTFKPIPKYVRNWKKRLHG